MLKTEPTDKRVSLQCKLQKYKYNTIEKKMLDKVEKTSINEATLKSFGFHSGKNKIMSSLSENTMFLWRQKAMEWEFRSFVILPHN